MDNDFAQAMARATAAVRSSDPMAATRIITEALGGKSARAAEPAPRPGPRLDPDAEIIEPIPAGTVPPDHAGATLERFARRLRRPLRDVVQMLREGHKTAGFAEPPAGFQHSAAPAPVPEGASFEERRFACAAGARDYKLYRPAVETPRGLVVMLHGCKQNPDDFATGTRMNAVAESYGLLVVYPRQTSADNMSSCWNWFRPQDQRRDQGEPAILAGITREIVAEFGIDPDKVFVAGLSAGGAMAAVLAETYPDLFKAVGIHSGIPTGAANDVISAFAAMRGDAQPLAQSTAPGQRAIVFHGNADRTVHPANAEHILRVAQGPRQSDSGQSMGGRPYVRTRIDGAEGAARMEVWMIEGAGHAWSGGNAAGSFTDPSGPDASTEMVRFFLAAN